MSYYDNSDLDLEVAHCGNVSCTAGNTLSTVDSAGDVGFYSSIAIGADGLPVLGYSDETSVGSEGLKVAHCGNVTCTAGNTLTTVDQLRDIGHSSIAIGADGLAVVSYWDDGNEDLKVAHCGNVTCSAGNTAITVDDSGTVGGPISIAIGADGLPVVSYPAHPGLNVAHCGDPACALAPPVPAELVLWNRLGSDAEVLNSAFGPNLAFYTGGCGLNVEGDSTYVPGVFGNAATLAQNPSCPPYSSTQRIHNIVLDDLPDHIDPEKGAVEVWYKQNEDPVAFSHGIYRIFGGGFGIGSIMVFQSFDPIGPEPADLFVGLRPDTVVQTNISAMNGQFIPLLS